MFAHSAGAPPPVVVHTMEEKFLALAFWPQLVSIDEGKTRRKTIAIGIGDGMSGGVILLAEMVQTGVKGQRSTVRPQCLQSTKQGNQQRKKQFICSSHPRALERVFFPFFCTFVSFVSIACAFYLSRATNAICYARRRARDDGDDEGDLCVRDWFRLMTVH